MNRIKLKIGKTFDTDYAAHWTTAPQAYDYDYVIEIYSDPVGEGRRLILIPVESCAYQIGRYQSGLYVTEPCEDFEEEHAERMLVDKVLTGTIVGV